jgi:hypothetical protein
MRVRLNTIGPRVDLLATWLSEQGLLVSEVLQTNSQRGFIIGNHDNPAEFLGDGISDGTRVMSIALVEEPDEE